MLRYIDAGFVCKCRQKSRDIEVDLWRFEVPV